MTDYKSMYLSLFNSVTDALNLLAEAQRDSEKIHIESDDDEKPISELQQNKIEC